MHAGERKKLRLTPVVAITLRNSCRSQTFSTFIPHTFGMKSIFDKRWVIIENEVWFVFSLYTQHPIRRNWGEEKTSKEIQTYFVIIHRIHAVELYKWDE